MIYSSNDLKTIFSTGNQANEDAFANLIDSSLNRMEDSVLFGPLGLTGRYGLLGPTGGTHLGLFYSGNVSPGSTSAPGSLGQVIISVTGGTGSLYIHNGSQWFVLPGLTSF